MAGGSGFGIEGQLGPEKQANTEGNRAPAPTSSAEPKTGTVGTQQAPATAPAQAAPKSVDEAVQQHIQEMHGPGGGRAAVEAPPAVTPTPVSHGDQERIDMGMQAPKKSYGIAGAAPIEGSPEATQATMDEAANRERVTISPAGQQAITDIQVKQAQADRLLRANISPELLAHLQKTNPGATQDEILNQWASEHGIDLNAPPDPQSIVENSTEAPVDHSLLSDLMARFAQGWKVGTSEGPIGSLLNGPLTDVIQKGSQSAVNWSVSANLMSDFDLYNQAKASGDMENFYVSNGHAPDRWWTPRKQQYYNLLIGNITTLSKDMGLPANDPRILSIASDHTREALGDISNLESLLVGAAAPTPANVIGAGTGEMVAEGAAALMA